MSDIQAGTMDHERETDENNRILHELLGAIRGINGGGGLIGQVTRIGTDVGDMKVTIATLATKEECQKYREGCVRVRSEKADHKWMRAKDAILVAVGVLGGFGTVFGIGRASGWW